MSQRQKTFFDRLQFLHLNAKFALLFIICFSIQLSAQKKTKNPHGPIKWDCFKCHTTSSWTEKKSPLKFSHDDTEFPLQGEHRFLECISCHQSLVFKEIGTTCADCHTDVHRGQFGLDCQSCHHSDNWKNVLDMFELHSSRGFPLIGVHAVADCQSCHVGEQRLEFSGTPTNCYGCHLADFALTTNPNHAKAQFSMDCQECHRPEANNWENAGFTHTNTFELRGAHVFADCNSCHANSFAGTPADCYSCHSQEYHATRDPNHETAGFATTCETCHSEISWDTDTFNHDLTAFPLTGQHRFANCADCHTNNVFAGTPMDCFSCHQTDYENTNDPNHIAAGFPNTCETCHTTNNWDSEFDHSTTGFSLEGQHRTTACADCHINNVFAGTPVECFACHQADYENTNDPNHIAAGFPNTCETCHTANNWDSEFDHSTTDFPLEGQHRNTACADCHINNVFAGTPAECFSCHQADYENTNDPNHIAAGFPTDCESCHNTNNWDDANFDHDSQFFPINSGKHRGEWNDCADCHVNPASFATFECIFCHEHRKSEMDDEHSEVNGYMYESIACLDCHPNGNSKAFKSFDRGFFPGTLDRTRGNNL